MARVNDVNPHCAVCRHVLGDEIQVKADGRITTPPQTLELYPNPSHRNRSQRSKAQRARSSKGPAVRQLTKLIPEIADLLIPLMCMAR
jgi:hypothetical protein